MADGDAEAVLERLDTLAPVVTGCAAESEQLGELAPAVVEALHGSGLFRALVPVEHGGIGLSLPESVAVFERVASFDASTGWVLVILADGPLFARLLAPAERAALLDDPAALVAGSLNPMTARAEAVDGGFVFSGIAGYLSGSKHATHIAATALVTDGGAIRSDPERGFEIRTGLFPVSEARGLDTWRVTGMRATGSHDHEFHDVFVPEGWTLQPFVPRPVIGADHFDHIPLWSKLGVGLAAVAVGCAQGALERFVAIAAGKVPVGGFTHLIERPHAQTAYGEAVGLHQAAHAVLHQTARTIWDRGVRRGAFSNEDAGRDRLGTVTAVRLAAQAIDRIHDVSGMTAVAADEVLERCWRDIHTMTQHVILAPERFEIAGRAVLGLDPRAPVI